MCFLLDWLGRTEWQVVPCLLVLKLPYFPKHSVQIFYGMRSTTQYCSWKKLFRFFTESQRIWFFFLGFLEWKSVIQLCLSSPELIFSSIYLLQLFSIFIQYHIDTAGKEIHFQTSSFKINERIMLLPTSWIHKADCMESFPRYETLQCIFK